MNYKSLIRCATSSAMLAGLSALLCTSPAAAGTVNNGTMFTHTAYDYAPAVIDSGSTRKIWWCGYGTPPGWMTQTDVIYYRTQNLSNGTYGSIQMVLWPITGSWDDTYVCDPSVVSGDFVDPNTSTHYSMAMYYGGTDNPAGDTRVGVAFSNDGVNWVRPTASPIISPAGGIPSGLYGAGIPSAYNSNTSGASVRLFYFDNTGTGPTNYTYTRTSTDGINFGSATVVQNSGLGTANTGATEFTREADFAWDPTNSYWYAAMPTVAHVRSMEATTYEFGIFKAASLTSGSWEPVGWVSSDTTGNALNHNPGLVRDPYGNLPSTSTIPVAFGSGTTTPTDWDLTLATVTPGANTNWDVYYDGVDLWSTTAFAPAGYSYSSNLGQLLPVRGSGLKPLYSCLAGSDQFTSSDEACEGQYVLGVTGYAYTSNVAGTHVVWRCYTGSNLFNYLVSSCGGFTLQGGLGFVP